MSTTMKSFRLPEWTITSIEQAAKTLDVPQAAVVSLAMEAFTSFGIADSLNWLCFRDNSADAYRTLIAMATRGGSIAVEIRAQLEACATFSPFGTDDERAGRTVAERDEREAVRQTRRRTAATVCGPVAIGGNAMASNDKNRNFEQKPEEKEVKPETEFVQEPVDSVELPPRGDDGDPQREFTWRESHAGGDDDIDDEPPAGDDGGDEEEGETVEVEEPVDSVEHPGGYGQDDDGKDDDEPEL